jgi:hypothetical protein
MRPSTIEPSRTELLRLRLPLGLVLEGGELELGVAAALANAAQVVGTSSSWGGPRVSPFV